MVCRCQACPFTKQDSGLTTQLEAISSFARYNTAPSGVFSTLSNCAPRSPAGMFSLVKSPLFPPSVSFFSLSFSHSRSADLDPAIRFHIRYPIQRPVRYPSLTCLLLAASRDRAPRHDVPVYLRYRRGVGVGR